MDTVKKFLADPETLEAVEQWAINQKPGDTNTNDILCERLYYLLQHAKITVLKTRSRVDTEQTT